jgi:two-component system nitrogen regulation sensor histidine kinase NtrY
VGIVHNEVMEPDRIKQDESTRGGRQSNLPHLRRRRWRIAVLAMLTALMFGLLFVQSAFNTLEWLRPKSVGETFSLYVLSTINFLAFVILLMVLVRNIIKLRRERRERKLGARFKTRLVVFFIALSLLPVTFLFFATTGLINRSIDKWFSLPGDEILKSAISMETLSLRGEMEISRGLCLTLARLLAHYPEAEQGEALAREVAVHGLIYAAVVAPPAPGSDEVAFLLERRLVGSSPPGAEVRPILREAARQLVRRGTILSEVPDPAEREIYLLSGAPLPVPDEGKDQADQVAEAPTRYLLLARRLPTDLSANLALIREQEERYEILKGYKKWYRSTMLQTLALITLLVLFIAFWMAINVSRGIAEPVQKLAEATARIKRGELDYLADVVGDDELAALARSFNEMTTELAENRRRLEQSANDLQVINTQLLERRQYIEAILQSLSAGVISLDETGSITTINEAALALLQIPSSSEPDPVGPDQVTGRSLELLLPEQQREELRRLIQLAARYRSVTREVHFTLANQVKLDAAVTVTALHDPAGEVRGAVIVVEDLSELIEAQRRAAWSEVARRMAHEIKNPLTPIRLSAERLARNLLGEPAGVEKSGLEREESCLSPRQVRMVRECTAMIGTEVATLQRMVDEFSTFARLPKIRLEPASLNEVVEKALRLYDGRLAGIELECRLDPHLPRVLIDSEQLRQVLINLIDNALEFIPLSPDERRLQVSTRAIPNRRMIELLVADTGPGIPPEHRERIFEPYFSTRKRGTGLGLAIVSRIVAEHHGRIRAGETQPHGASFLIELPWID